MYVFITLLYSSNFYILFLLIFYCSIIVCAKIHITFTVFFKHLFIYMQVHVGEYVAWCMCGSQRPLVGVGSLLIPCGAQS